MEPEASLRGKGSLAGPAGQLPLLLVDTPVVVELGGNSKGLSAVMASVAPRFRVDTTMVLQGKQVGVGLEAHGAVVDADSMGVFVVEEGAGMAVGTAALITSLVSPLIQFVQTSEKSEFRHAYGPKEAGLEIIYVYRHSSPSPVGAVAFLLTSMPTWLSPQRCLARPDLPWKLFPQVGQPKGVAPSSWTFWWLRRNRASRKAFPHVWQMCFFRCVWMRMWLRSAM